MTNEQLNTIVSDLTDIRCGVYESSQLGIKLDLIQIANIRINLDIDIATLEESSYRNAIFFNSDLIALLIQIPENILHGIYEGICMYDNTMLEEISRMY